MNNSDLEAWERILAYALAKWQERFNDWRSIDLDSPENANYASPWLFGDATEFPKAFEWLSALLRHPEDAK